MSRVLRPRIAKILAKRIKWEGLAPHGEKGVMMLEAISRAVWTCADPEGGCPVLEPLDIAKANQQIEAMLPGPVAYYSLEGIASKGDQILLATRGLMPEDAGEDDFRPWPVVVKPTGESVYDGKPWNNGGKDFGISDIALDGDVLWLTWSHEVESNNTSEGVAGILGRAALDPKTGLPGPPKACTELKGKPEGLAVHGDNLVVVFDNDRARKGTDPSRFAITPAQDFARVVPKSACK